MKREGNIVLFDSEEQQRQFEEVIHVKEGADIVCSTLSENGVSSDAAITRQFFAEVGKANRDLTNWWSKILREVGDIGAGNVLSYDWSDRRLNIIAVPEPPKDIKKFSFPGHNKYCKK